MALFTKTIFKNKAGNVINNKITTGKSYGGSSRENFSSNFSSSSFSSSSFFSPSFLSSSFSTQTMKKEGNNNRGEQRKLFVPLTSTTSPSPFNRTTQTPTHGYPMMFSNSYQFYTPKRYYTSKNHTMIRNVAIIAHVDHGKTTLVDKILIQSGCLEEVSGTERVMDSNTLEKERGITIMAKNTSIVWKDYQINIVDTPGHGDFGGEVERILSMVDGVVLIVDATEGPMTQTKFVLSKALKKGLKPIVLINKLDRDTARTTQVESEIFDLFIELEANEDQMEYPTLYASGRDGWAIKKVGDKRESMEPLIDAIVEHVPVPKVEEGPFKMLISTLDYEPHLGRIVMGKITSGSVKPGDKLKSLMPTNELVEEGTALRLIVRRGIQTLIMESGSAGDIVGVAGFPKSTASHTLCTPSETEALPSDPIDPPVLSMTFAPNTSPLSGQEGALLSIIQIRDRLEKETQHNVAIKVQYFNDRAEVSGRGELQLGVLIENMRREGFELSISPPQVVYIEENSKKMEPREEVIIDIDREFSGLVMDKMTMRKGELDDMQQNGNKVRVKYLIASRALIGLRQELSTETRGNAVVNHLFYDYIPFQGQIEDGRKGVIVSTESGVVTTYALKTIESRGILFVGPQAKTYEGMIIGENSKKGDIDVNPIKSKHLTNFRTTSKDEAVKLTPPRAMTLEEAISYVRDGELIEVTPKSIRLRKKILNCDERARSTKHNKRD